MAEYCTVRLVFTRILYCLYFYCFMCILCMFTFRLSAASARRTYGQYVEDIRAA